eukprot:g12725.t1
MPSHRRAGAGKPEPQAPTGSSGWNQPQQTTTAAEGEPAPQQVEKGPLLMPPKRAEKEPFLMQPKQAGKEPPKEQPQQAPTPERKKGPHPGPQRPKQPGSAGRTPQKNHESLGGEYAVRHVQLVPTDSWLYVPFLADALDLGPPTTRFTPPPWWQQAVLQHRQVLIAHGLHGLSGEELDGATDHGPGQAYLGFGRWYIATTQQEQWMTLGPLGQQLGFVASDVRAAVQQASVRHQGASALVSAAHVRELATPDLS